MKIFKKVLWAVMVLVFSVSAGTAALAEEDSSTPKQPEQKETKASKANPKEMQDLTMSMAPAFGTMAESMLDGIYNGLSKPQTAKKLAKFTRNYYKALIAEGFSKKEAFQLIKAFPVPSMGGK